MLVMSMVSRAGCTDVVDVFLASLMVRLVMGIDLGDGNKSVG